MAKIRLKCFWGALDLELNDEQAYTPQEVKPLGENANEPGTAVRRVQFVFTRGGLTPPQDAATTHLDFLNLTNGEPDDTWIDADFSDLEEDLDVLVTTLLPFMPNWQALDQYRWYREGAAIAPPNPAIRVVDRNMVGTATSSTMLQQAVSVTFKTVPRRCWGRSYMPLTAGSLVPGLTGRFTPANVDVVANAFNNCLESAISKEFLPVVFSKRRGKAYGIEAVQVDDVPDVIRSRRLNEAVYRKVLT